MSDSASAIWAAIVGGSVTLLGVGLGSKLSFGATKRINELQAAETRKIRRVDQLERLDRNIENIGNLADSLLTQAIGYVGHGRKFDGEGLAKVSFVESEFLVRVYLPEAIGEFNQLHVLSAEQGRLIGEIVLSRGDKEAGSNFLTRLVDNKAATQEQIRLLRTSLVEAVKSIEKI